MQATRQEAAFPEPGTTGLDPSIASSNWVVMKFGGSSVATGDNWATIAGLIRNRIDDGLKPLVVHSAIAGVSNALESLLIECVSGDPAGCLQDIKSTHVALGRELGVDAEDLLEPWFSELDQLVAGMQLTREASPRLHARVVACGELMATSLGAAYLERVGISTGWCDARELVTCEYLASRSERQNYMSAICPSEPDTALRRIAESIAADGKVMLTQGFIGSNTRSEVVLLGREGSDTSAAHFAAQLPARRVEIWTDVPGMFSADPRLVPSARLLVELHYDEAQELASTGSKVLHPRCLSPLKQHGIPLFVRSTRAPEVAGTMVSSTTTDVNPHVKGISAQGGVTLISMEGSRMWHEIGFLADVFSFFRKHAVSVDLVSTSETNVTVSIDTAEETPGDDVMQALIRDLESLCRVRVVDDCAMVSLVGRKIRTILPRLAPALEVFAEEKIHLVSQAANDLNFSFVIDNDQVQRLIGRLHASIIHKSGDSTTFGSTWEQLQEPDLASVRHADAWWLSKRDQLLDIAESNRNAFVYDADSVRMAVSGLRDLKNLDRVLYAMKANFNPELLRILAKSGVDFECVSPGEVEHLMSSVPGLGADRILFTPNFAPREEYEWALSSGLQLTLDNLHPLQEWPELFGGVNLFIRIDPGQGRGHHQHVRTAGEMSKFGVPRFETDELVRLIKRAGAEVTGIHAHSGSGILDPENWRAVAAELAQVAQHFPAVEVLDLGGGLGVPDRSRDAGFDLAALDETLAGIKSAYPAYRLWLEPGRFLVAQAGVLLSRVTQVKGKGDRRYVGVGTGMNSLIRPALYGAYHEIANLSRVHEVATELTTVVGPICESGDKLGSDRLLPPSREDDVMIIANAGAYGRVMSSQYNMRPTPPEIVI
ncbi:MAG: bifunctional aspartate kinase/diaminopimelate decarboxylase [Gammaproteobacteria bacterium]|nr:bifunctional aspartate kinase/diaminopimelate decarboxylase [Gammaproteobacteria bacterium]